MLFWVLESISTILSKKVHDRDKKDNKLLRYFDNLSKAISYETERYMKMKGTKEWDYWDGRFDDDNLHKLYMKSLTINDLAKYQRTQKYHSEYKLNDLIRKKAEMIIAQLKVDKYDITFSRNIVDDKCEFELKKFITIDGNDYPMERAKIIKEISELERKNIDMKFSGPCHFICQDWCTDLILYLLRKFNSQNFNELTYPKLMRIHSDFNMFQDEFIYSQGAIMLFIKMFTYLKDYRDFEISNDIDNIHDSTDDSDTDSKDEDEDED